MLQQRVYHGRIRDVDHLKQRLIGEWRCFGQNTIDRTVRQCGVFDYARVSVQTAATLSTNCNWCFCATFLYWKLLYLSFIFTALHEMQTRSSDENSVCLSVCLSVRLSVRRVIPDKMEERSVQIFIPYERTFSLVF